MSKKAIPSNNFKSRWGLSILDDYRYLTIPGFIMRNWAKFVSVQEWVFIQQVMSFKYDSENGAAMPSLETISLEMGYKTTRTVQKQKSELIKRGLMTEIIRPGETSIYEFQGFAEKCLQAEQGMKNNSGVKDFSGVKNNSGVGVKNFSPEDIEEKNEKKEKEITLSSSDDAISSNPDKPSDKYSKHYKLVVQYIWSNQTDYMHNQIMLQLLGKQSKYKTRNAFALNATTLEAMAFKVYRDNRHDGILPYSAEGLHQAFESFRTAKEYARCMELAEERMERLLITEGIIEKAPIQPAPVEEIEEVADFDIDTFLNEAVDILRKKENL